MYMCRGVGLKLGKEMLNVKKRSLWVSGVLETWVSISSLLGIFV